MSDKLKDALLFDLPPDMGTRIAKLHDVEETGSTGERLAKWEPELVRIVLRLRGEGMSIDRIARAVGWTPHSVLAVLSLRRDTVEALRAETVAIGARGRHELMLSILDDVMHGRLKPEHKALALTMVNQVVELLSGGVTSRTERVISEEEQESEAFFRQARQQLAASGAEKVLEAEILPQIGAAAASEAGALHAQPARDNSTPKTA